ncbi:hypothetical protein [Lapillicoccus sp.]|uniref:WXG100 family type VII secretion target n=1 Tax=Lapillicoccus sp. TaxID=1909287 RepID=UPI0027C5E2F2|nr:hypothetical protein [Actinomycetota bacterium]
MGGSGDQILISSGELENMATEIGSAHKKLDSGFQELTADLLRTMAEWGEGTASRTAFNDFKRRVDKIFAEMLVAQAKMPPVVQQAAQDATSTENYLANNVWSG